jgi:hypothetical protein
MARSLSTKTYNVWLLNNETSFEKIVVAQMILIYLGVIHTQAQIILMYLSVIRKTA